MHQQLSDKDMEQYFRTGILPSSVRPTRCAQDECQERHRFHRHSQFPRKCVYRKDGGWAPFMWVQRFRCVACNKVFSLLIPIVYKWQRAEHALQQDVALDKKVGNEVLESFSERTLRRWKHKWQEWAEEYLQIILKWLLTWYSSISTDLGRRETLTPLGYLRALLKQVPGKVLGAVAVTSAARFGGRSDSAIPHFLSLVFL